MIGLVRGELLKLRSTQVWFWLLLGALALSALVVVVPLAVGAVDDGRGVADMFRAATFAYVVIFVLGVLGVTTEFRYQTITPALLATPSRWTFVTAKMITYTLVGIGYALACVVLQLLIAVPWLHADGVEYSFGGDSIGHTIIGVFVVLALFGMIGLGVGALVKNQIVAVVVGIIFLLVVQPIVAGIPGVKHVYPYLPAGGVQSVQALTVGDRAVNGFSVFPVAGGVIVLLLWAFVPAIIGAAFTLNRDIT